ncbi:MAG: hypothetical protein KF681_07885 [Bdellovibrionaceae bacterium]|nr:hypothetical protein [Pseudobdellovibrionaceae bacterium]
MPSLMDSNLLLLIFGVLGVLVAGLLVAAMWLASPQKKKRALAQLAESASLSKDDVLKIAQDLR